LVPYAEKYSTGTSSKENKEQAVCEKSGLAWWPESRSDRYEALRHITEHRELRARRRVRPTGRPICRRASPPAEVPTRAARRTGDRGPPARHTTDSLHSTFGGRIWRKQTYLYWKKSTPPPSTMEGGLYNPSTMKPSVLPPELSKTV